MKKIFLIPFVCILAITSSCKKKEASLLGVDIQPDNDLVNAFYSDTTSIYTHTVKIDSTRSYNDQFKYLGSNQDPLFGRTDASIYTNLSLPNNITSLSFGSDAVLDSSFIILRFTQRYVGDTTTPLKYEVFPLLEKPLKDTAYYTNRQLSKSNGSISSSYQRIHYKNGKFYVKLPINTSFATALLSNDQYLTDNSTFQNTYKGFYVTTSGTSLNPSVQGALLKFDLDDDTSGVYLHYHNGTSPSIKVSKTFQFTFKGIDAVRYNYVNHNYTSGANTSLYQQLQGDTTKGNQLVFPQGLGATKVKVHIPFLKNYSDSFKVSINRAELIFKIDETYFTNASYYSAPLTLALVAIDSLGKEAYTKDQLSTTDAIKYGGDYDETTKSYTFNIARHAQDVVDGKIKNHGFYLVVASNQILTVIRRDNNAERIVLGGHSNFTYKPQLKVTYTKFPFDK